MITSLASCMVSQITHHVLAQARATHSAWRVSPPRYPLARVWSSVWAPPEAGWASFLDKLRQAAGS